MASSKKNIRQLSKFAGISVVAILVILIAFIGIGLVRNFLGVHCVGLMGSSDCISEMVFSPIVFIGLPIALIIVGLVEIIYMSKDIR